MTEIQEREKVRYQVPFARRGSVVDNDDLDALSKVVRSDEPLSSGQWRDEFERRFREHIGTRHALSVTSGTVALEIAIRLLNLRPGDEVVATCQTFQASIQPLLAMNVAVRFCDIDPDTLNLDPDKLEALITPRTKAVILVHYAGNPARMREIVAIARRHGLLVLEDAAHALGSGYQGRRPGSLGDIGCFSFHSSKNMTTLGEGGMLTFDRDDWAARADRIRSNEVDMTAGPVNPALGAPPDVLPWMKFSSAIYRESYTAILGAGTNATLSEPACATGIVQLDKMAGLVRRRRAIAARLDEVLGRYPEIRLPVVAAGDEHAYHLYTCFVTDGADARHALITALDRRGIEVQLRYFPLHLTPEWQARGHGPGECPVAEKLWFSEHVNLPCHPGLSETQVSLLCSALDASLHEVFGRRSSLARG
ncbi:DegT/DnrJ/EryC1/StrS family aminotransferase [Amycolatopsis anabasis]|uniref:DegT/DnrJ/EryC1/StrS family aminotransferase n=1 Tax=Amycolatopsis anabasis TaxID=1840409 RepID=UPI001FE6F52B|nr:DegT/DnrJ/EryC1/StrS family aminotransferase [Amycolatopsis anabasis]